MTKKKSVWNIGIYRILNIITGDFYVGQSINLRQRKGSHFSKLGKNDHHNPHLQRAFNKYGKENLKFEIILYCEEFELTRYENAIRNANKLITYNIREVVDSNKGLIRSEETKLKISISHVGNQYALGSIHSEETRQKMRDNHADFKGENHPSFGKHRSEESREKMSKSNHNAYTLPSFLGKHHTEESKRKISENNPNSLVNREKRRSEKK